MESVFSGVCGVHVFSIIVSRGGGLKAVPFLKHIKCTIIGHVIMCCSSARLLALVYVLQRFSEFLHFTVQSGSTVHVIFL